ncbi:bacterial extracellular solute-binding s, 5 Middle family protein [Collimonas arenae]|uniref:Bacterial extracellular solute-binding s, 5 Middle family protein n=1 Tax=Collimonas arenae TaxID=279058 RepID=A0A127PMV4_9BURK|nr:ABC transporter substrate-binding protein [Collimonas arenae]AMO99119.1 bacterial extracellular solute-binding s, 5 Middle family protein [Collimonas arenae]AMP09019.1 bacterial extracellular solute-binding s, 5 Middle family protein [Collimonas arenae]
MVRVAFESADDGFDMVRTYNAFSSWVSEAIFERLLTYDYLARPSKLVPGTAEAMPEVLDGGKTYVFHIKKGIYFAPDPAFKGVRRELTAQDYAYTLKRFLDPKNRSPSANVLDGKIAGMDELVAKAKKSGRFDYDAPVAGLQTPDRYTLKIGLNAPDYNFMYIMAFVAMGAQAHEVIDAYGDQSGQHPVGTGPYMLQEYVPRSKIVLVANPEYRGYTWDFKSDGSAWDDQLVHDMKGKRMPQIGRVEINIIEEEQSRWLAFQGKQLDFDYLPQTAAPTVLNGKKLKPSFVDEGIKLYTVTEPGVVYTFLNFKDPLIGGTSLAKNALRRAIAMSYNVQDEITQVRMGLAVKAEMPIPEGVVGHDPNYRSSIAYDPVLANKLLDHFGYKRGADGYRTLPDGSPLTLKIATEANAINVVFSEIWKRGLDQIGIRTDFKVSNFADNLKAATECKLMMWNGSWIADYPEGDNFMQLLYGPNVGQGNNGCYSSPAYDALYVKAKALPPGPERNQLYIEMTRQMEADTAWMLSVSRLRNWMIRPWIKGFKHHPILWADWQYLDIEKH